MFTQILLFCFELVKGVYLSSISDKTEIDAKCPDDSSGLTQTKNSDPIHTNQDTKS